MKLELWRDGHADIVWVLAAGPHADKAMHTGTSGPLPVVHFTSHAANRPFKQPTSSSVCVANEILPHKAVGAFFSGSELIRTALPAKKASHNAS